MYTDDARACIGLTGFKREAVKHGAGEYVRKQAHTSGIESFWSMLKRGYVGTCHKMSFKHLDRYAAEFAGRHNVRRHRHGATAVSAGAWHVRQVPALCRSDWAP